VGFQIQARTERSNISKSLFACKLAEGSSVSPHVIKMIGYIDTLDILGSELHPDLVLMLFSSCSRRAISLLS
jgi:hypothetical protein